jgi:IS5 family transposase
MIPWLASEVTMRPKQHTTTGSADLFRARLDQIINLKHELVALAGKIDWAWIDGEIAPLYGDQGRPGIAPASLSSFCCSSTFTGFPTRVCASAGSTTRISSTSREKSSSSMNFRTSART